MRTQKIKFQTANAELDIQTPFPASRFMPEWYRKLKSVKEGGHTVKRCVPYLDAMTSGYIIPLTADVTWNKEADVFHSHAATPVVSRHFDYQVEGIAVPPGFSGTPHKWNNQWFIQTPKGYSTLFIHPLNRPDLPFYSFSGVVDTDKHPVIINFPFVLHADFEGTIPAGTPLIQAIPFKRSDWKSEINDSISHYYPKEYEVEVPPFAWYKRKWWSRKLYS